MENGKQVAIPARCSKRRRVDAPSSSTSAAPGNGGGLPEDVTSDRHTVLEEPPPPPPPSQASAQFIEAQGEPPTGGSKWNFNLEEESPDVPIALPPVPPDWVILESLPSEDKRATLAEEVIMGMMRCVEQHRLMAG